MNFDYGTVQEVESSLGHAENIIGDLSSIIGDVADIFNFAAAGIGAVVAIVSAIFAAIVFVALYIIHSIPAYALAKKAGVKHAWLAWIPVFNEYFRLLVLCDMAGEKPFHPGFGKFSLENRRLPIIVHVLVKYTAGLLIKVASAAISIAIPVVGSVSVLLNLLPSAACGIIDFVYFRDMLAMYKDNKKSNMITAIVVSAADALALGGLARTAYMYTLLGKQPLPAVEITAEAVETVPAE